MTTTTIYFDIPICHMGSELKRSALQTLDGAPYQ